MRKETRGTLEESVVVAGAGIAGMQCALDLAISGYHVFLLEKSPAIGGVMARLDKTFPTSDCAMCAVSPKLVEVGRHPNIELLTNTDLLRLTDGPGNFVARVRRRAPGPFRFPFMKTASKTPK